MLDKEQVGLSYYFIDYDNQLEYCEDQYHVFYGQDDDIDFSEYIAAFEHEDDAQEFVEWKNEQSNTQRDNNDMEDGDDPFDEKKWEE